MLVGPSYGRIETKLSTCTASPHSACSQHPPLSLFLLFHVANVTELKEMVQIIIHYSPLQIGGAGSRKDNRRRREPKGKTTPRVRHHPSIVHLGLARPFPAASNAQSHCLSKIEPPVAYIPAIGPHRPLLLSSLIGCIENLFELREKDEENST